MNSAQSLETWLESLVGILENGEHLPAVEMTDGRLSTASSSTLDSSTAQRWARGKANELGHTKTVRAAYVAVCKGDAIHLYRAATLDEPSGLWLDEADCYRNPVRLSVAEISYEPPLRLSPLAESAERAQCAA